MAQQKDKVVNKRAEAGSGKKHDKHAPASKEDIAAAKENPKATATSDE